MKRAPRLRFDAEVIIHGPLNPLLAAEIPFGCLHGNVAQKELNLLQFAACGMAQLCARAAKIMWSEPRKTEFLRVLFHHVPDHPLRYSITPMLACSTDASKQPSCRNPGRRDPQIHGRLDPAGHRYGPNVSAFAYQIDDCPMVLALLYMGELQVGQFAAPQTAAKQYGENCPVSFAFERVRVRRLPEFAGLVSGEPISKPDTQLPGPFHPPDAGGELRTEQASVGSLVGEPPHCSESSIDRSCRELPILEENAITSDHNLVERQVAARSSTTE